MAEIEEARLLVKLARMYYQHEMTQAQIATRVGMSRQKVQRLLTKARQTETVHILIKPLLGVDPELERALEDKYGLRDVVITETEDYRRQEIVTGEVAAAAADYLCRAFRSHDRIALAWGGTVKETIDALYHHPRPDIRDMSVVQGFGGLGDTGDVEHVTFLVQRLAAWLGADGHIMPGPALAGSAQVRRAFCSDSSIATVLDRARSASVLIVGTGGRAQARRLLKSYADRYPALRGMPVDAAGDINLRFFDAVGRPVTGDFDDRLIGLTIDEMRKIDMVVAVAGGAAKFDAILAAVRGRIMNVLVTDNVTARRLMDARQA